MILDKIPVFAIQLESLLELEVFFVGPASIVNIALQGSIFESLLLLSHELAACGLAQVRAATRDRVPDEGPAEVVHINSFRYLVLKALSGVDSLFFLVLLHGLYLREHVLRRGPLASPLGSFFLRHRGELLGLDHSLIKRSALSVLRVAHIPRELTVLGVSAATSVSLREILTLENHVELRIELHRVSFASSLPLRRLELRLYLFHRRRSLGSLIGDSLSLHYSSCYLDICLLNI